MLITITGATGRTGRRIVGGLLAAGHTVRGLVRSDAQAAELGAAGAVPVLGDLTSSDLAALLKGSDALGHAAVDAGVQRMVQVSPMYADRPEAGPPFCTTRCTRRPSPTPPSVVLHKVIHRAKRSC